MLVEWPAITRIVLKKTRPIIILRNGNTETSPIIQKEGYIEKCRFCIEFVEKGEKPACMTTCMTGVRMFGDLDDPNSEISRTIIKNKLKQLKAELTTKQRIYYKKK